MEEGDDDVLNTEAFFRSGDIVGKKIVIIASFSAIAFFVLGLWGMYIMVGEFQHALYLEGIMTFLLALCAIAVALLLFVITGTVIGWGGKVQRVIESAKG